VSSRVRLGAIFDYDIALVNADAELDAIVTRRSDIGLGHAALPFGRQPMNRQHWRIQRAVLTIRPRCLYFGPSALLPSPWRMGHRRSSWSARSKRHLSFGKPGSARSASPGRRDWLLRSQAWVRFMAEPPMASIFGNSPFEISDLDFWGKTIIQRTSAGTQGIVEAATKAERLYAASLVTAEANRPCPSVGLTRSSLPRRYGGQRHQENR
jgi:hypothetical protein